MQETMAFTYRMCLSQPEWKKASEARHAAGEGPTESAIQGAGAQVPRSPSGLPVGRGRDPIRVRLPEEIPAGTIVQAALGVSAVYLLP